MFGVDCFKQINFFTISTNLLTLDYNYVATNDLGRFPAARIHYGNEEFYAKMDMKFDGRKVEQYHMVLDGDWRTFCKCWCD